MTIPLIAAHYGAGAADGSNTELSFAGISGRCRALRGLRWSYSAAPTRGGIDVRSGIEMLAALNSGFEVAGAGGADIWGSWVETAGDGALANETTIRKRGANAAKVTAGVTANTKIASPSITVVGDTSYTLSFWTRGDATNSGRYLIYDVTHSANIVATTSAGVVGTTFTKVTVAFTTPTDCIAIRLDLMCPAANGGIAYYDEVSLGLTSDVPTILWNIDISAAGWNEILFPAPCTVKAGSALTIILKGGGGTVRGRLEVDEELR